MIDPEFDARLRSKFPANPNVPNAWGKTWNEHVDDEHCHVLSQARGLKRPMSAAEEWFRIVRALKTEVPRERFNRQGFNAFRRMPSEKHFSWTWGKQLYDMLTSSRWPKPGHLHSRQAQLHHARYSSMSFNRFLRHQRKMGAIVKSSDGYMIPMHRPLPSFPLYGNRWHGRR